MDNIFKNQSVAGNNHITFLSQHSTKKLLVYVGPECLVIYIPDFFCPSDWHLQRSVKWFSPNYWRTMKHYIFLLFIIMRYYFICHTNLIWNCDETIPGVYFFAIANSFSSFHISILKGSSQFSRSYVGHKKLCSAAHTGCTKLDLLLVLYWLLFDYFPFIPFQCWLYLL